jgi:alpha-glucosidase
MKNSGLIHFSAVTTFDYTETGIVARLDDELLRIDVIKDDLIRVSISRGGKFDESPTFALAIDPLSIARESIKNGQLAFSVTEANDKILVTTGAINLEIVKQPFAFNAYRSDGSAIFETAHTRDGQSGAYSVLNDTFVLRRKIGKLDPIYGLGEKTGSFNRRGRDFTLWNVDVLNPTASGEFTKEQAASDPRADNTSTEFDPYYMSIPFFYHQDAKTSAIGGSYIDNGYRGFYDFTGADSYQISFSGGQYNEYVFAGPSMPSILEDYTWLTGRTNLPPIWSLGFHQCRWKDYVQADIEALAAKYREKKIPVDSLWLDIDYMDEYRVFTWNTDRYPDAEGMLSRLKEQGIRAITIIDPGVKHDPGYSVYDDGVEKGVFATTESGSTYIGQVWPGNTAFPDFVQESTRKWWGALNAEHVKSGLAGIWNDMNEPATGDISPYPMRFGAGEYSHDRYHNSYALLMAMGTHEGLLQAMPELRTFILSRAGSAGIQRYAANWMGDNMSRFDHLWMSIPMGSGLSISGQSFVGADIAGFGEDTTAELMLRWTQYGALTPFARNHSVIGTVDQYPWSFGPDVEAGVRSALELRYRLLPYIYTAFVRASETGAPIQRPLIFDFQADEQARNLDDQYLFGSDVLVAPIVEDGQRQREVYLPAGEWFDFNSGEHLAGGQTVIAAAPLEFIPVFVRAGAVLPMLDQAPQTTDGLAPESIELHVFVPETDGEWASELQEDDGLTHAALEDNRVRTSILVSRIGDSITVSGKSLGKGFAGFARNQFVLVWHTSADSEVGNRNGTRQTIANSGEDFSVSL